MSKINIVNYLIGELEEENQKQHNQNENENIIDDLIDKWSRKEYLNIDTQENTDT